MSHTERENHASLPPMGGTKKVERNEIMSVEGNENMPVEKTEVVPVAKRRRFSDAYKLRILDEVDRAAPGETGLILRREGLYASQISTWKKRRNTLKSQKGKSGNQAALDKENQRLHKENAQLKLKLKKADAMLELQKKTVALMEMMDQENNGASGADS